jgi:mannosyltransferase OCH1-like enzyme
VKIPKIIHQIWAGGDELSEYFAALSETWKRDYPDWKYIQWDNQMMVDFITKHYPQYVGKYESFPSNIQRWDAIRYLILDRIGGMYVDFDYESIKPMDELIADETCCFGMEPDAHRGVYNDSTIVFNNAMMLSVPGHPFMRKVIEYVFENKDMSKIPEDRFRQVLYTTGPGVLIELYEQLTPTEKDIVYLIPAKYVTPFNSGQARRFTRGEMSEELEQCLEEAYAVHFFFTDWAADEDNDFENTSQNDK